MMNKIVDSIKTQIFLLIFIIIIHFICSIGSSLIWQSKSVDKKFIASVHDGLCDATKISIEYRQRSDNDNTYSTYIDYYYSIVNAILSQVNDYREMEFENKELGDKANQFIDQLETIKEKIYIFEDKYKTGDSDVDFYLNDISIEFGKLDGLVVDFSNHYLLKLGKIKSEYENNYKKSIELDTFIKDIKSCEFKKSNEFENKISYTATIKNTTDTTFEFVKIKIIAKDKDGHILSIYNKKEGKTFQFSNLKPGDEENLYFVVDGEIDKTDILVCALD